MPASTPVSLFDVALFSSTSRAIPYSQGPSSVPGFDASLTWDSASKAHRIRGLPIQTATLSTYSVASSVVTLTATAPLGSGYQVGNYVTILVSDANTWLNGTWLIEGVTATTFVVVIAGSSGSGSVAGTAEVNPQTANLASHQDGDGNDLVTVGPLGSLAISGSTKNESPLLDIRQTSPTAPLMARFFIPGFPDTPRAYMSNNAGYYNISEVIVSARTNGLTGLNFRILPPTDDACMIGVGMDVGVGIVVRDSGLAGSMAYQAVDRDARYLFAVMASNGKLVWGNTTSKDVNGTPLFDTNLYRDSAGILATDSVFITKVTTGVSPNPQEVRGTANALLWFVDSNGNPTVNNANPRLTLGSTNQMALSHDGNGRLAVNSGNYSLAVAQAGRLIALEVEGGNRFLVGRTSATFGEGVNIVFGTTTGSMIGAAASQKLSLWGATPIVQPSATGETAGFTAGIGTAVKDDSTFTGNVGSTAYRISDVVKALKRIGALAS